MNKVYIYIDCHNKYNWMSFTTEFIHMYPASNYDIIECKIGQLLGILAKYNSNV